MTAKFTYKTAVKIVFTDADIATAMEWERESNPTKTLADLNFDNLPVQSVSSATLTAFAKLADALGFPVSKGTYSGLQIVRPYTDDELRESAMSTLKYGYGEKAAAIRTKRAEEQGIDPDGDET